MVLVLLANVGLLLWTVIRFLLQMVVLPIGVNVNVVGGRITELKI